MPKALYGIVALGAGIIVAVLGGLTLLGGNLLTGLVMVIAGGVSGFFGAKMLGR